MHSEVRITHLGGEGPLNIRTVRQDVGDGEPQSLGNEIQVAPGDAVVVAVYAGCALVVTPIEEKRG
jgi:hypothetical protein